MATITLDEIRASLDAKYAPLVVDLGDGDAVTLVQAVRLPKDKRDHLKAIQAGINGDDTDGSFEAMRELIRLVGTGAVDGLLAAAGDDIAFLMEVINQWTGATQAPEASPSPA